MSKIITVIPTAYGSSTTIGGQSIGAGGDYTAGYFRIGNQILSIPPEQIQCHKIINGDEVIPLRFAFAMPIKTGQSRWDVTWSWKALADFDNDDYTQWVIVQNLLAMVKAAPFVEVENSHIRQLINPSTINNGATNDDVMGFVLRQMRVDTVPDIIDALQITMTMSLFNYRPYSKSFQYDNGAGVPAPSAMQSPPFYTYLQNWINTNINQDPTQQPSTSQSVSATDWQNLAQGELTLSAREYQVCELPYPITNGAGNGTPNPANPGSNAQGSNTLGNQNGFVNNVFVNPVATSNPQIQWWVAAVTSVESAGSGGYNAINFQTTTNTGAPSAAVGLLQWVRGSAIDAMKGADKYVGTNYISTALQAGYIIPSVGSSNQYTWNKNKTVSNPQSSDLALATYISWMQSPPSPLTSSKLQNDMATGWAMLKLVANQGGVLNAWRAHYFGQGIVNKGQNIPASQAAYFTKLVNSWKASASAAGTPNLQAFMAPPTPINVTAPPPSPDSIATTGTLANNNTDTSNTSTTPGQVPFTDQIRYLISEGWIYDYFTEKAAFLYKEHYITMASSDTLYGGVPSSSDLPNIDPQHFVYPNQISVVFSNNIAQLPLSSYQYPTYQHLGPVSTLVSIGLLSNAVIPPATDTYIEPQHIGLSYISDLTSLLEDQFQRLRNEWRRVNSIQRMQAISVKSQVLNLLGIRGLLTKELTTETVPDSPNLVSAQYNAIQYENVFEEINADPFYTGIVPALFAQTWLDVLQQGLLNPYSSDTGITQLIQLGDAIKAAVLSPQPLLYKWMTSSSPLPDSNVYNVPTPTPFNGDEIQAMTGVLSPNAPTPNTFTYQYTATLSNLLHTVNINTSNFSQAFPDVGNPMLTHNPYNYSDYFLLRNYVYLNPKISGANAFNAIISGIDARVEAALAANPSLTPPIQQLFEYYIGYAFSNNVNNIATQFAEAATIPAIRALFVNANTTQTPGSSDTNSNHGCYKDLGLSAISVGGKDNNPASYFYDDSAAINQILQSQKEDIVNKTVKTSQVFSANTPIVDRQNLIQASTQDFTGNVDGIISSIETSAYTMAKAFPTFKLFLMEDNSFKPFYSFDNFASYATVIDMEIIRYRDKPDEARIQISNLMHLLDQHLYDSTPQGKEEQLLNANLEVGLNPSDGALTANGGIGGQQVATQAGGFPVISLDNRSTQINPTGAGDQKFPLKYFALQTGTKIQIRMGFSNNPDLLTPVFTGQVTEIEGDEILNISAQSFLLELVNPTTDIIRDGGFAVDTFINQVSNAILTATRDTVTNLFDVPGDILSILDNEAAYGGGGDINGIRIPGLVTAGGGTQDVISAMLHVSSAKHFGHWQWGSSPDPFIKGFTWQEATASALSVFGITGLESGYDRSFENVLTSHVFGPDGTAVPDTSGSARGWWFERPAGYGAPSYHIPKDVNITPWTIIQDIARRYPEFILSVKQFGFPYTADATLVFANPHDFYASRPTLPADLETVQQAQSNTKLFNAWWSGSGSNSGRSQFIGFCTTVGGKWLAVTVGNYLKSITSEISAILTPNSLSTNANILANYIDSGGANVFFNIVGLYDSIVGSSWQTALAEQNLINLVTGYNPYSSGLSQIQVQQNLEQVVQNYYNYINQQNAGTTNGAILNPRMKMVRKFHLINGDNIVHNGIMLNDSFYNTVKLDNTQIRANAAISPNYVRLLNADPLIVSKDNLKSNTQYTNTYIQSFLRDEVAKAYRGEMVLTGNPDIEPFDVLVFTDPSTGISGPVEVDSVIHSFNKENGYITIVRPRAFVIINDLLSAPVYLAVWGMLGQVQAHIASYTSNNNVNDYAVGATGAIAGAALIAGAIAAGPWVAGAAALSGTMSLFWAGKQTQQLNPLGIVPLTRFDRPWISGLQGWRTDDLFQYLSTAWHYFKVDEIENTLYAFRVARGMNLIKGFH